MRGTSTVPGHALPTRRAVLVGVAAAVAAGVSGCDLRLEGGDPPRSSGRRRTPSPDERAQREQLRVATSLAAATRAVPAALAVRPLLNRCAAQDDAHAAALGPALTATTAPAATAPAAVPGSHATVTVAALGTSLATAAVDARAGLHDLTPGTARLLASVAAARTVQRSRLVPGSVPATVAVQPATAPTAAPTASSTGSPTGSPTAAAGLVSTSGAALAASSPSGATTGRVAALDRALAAEHAALYGLGVAGAWASPADRLRMLAAQTWHAARREALTDLVRGAGGTPSSALAAYRLPFPVTSPAAARALAVAVEVRVATTYADLVADGPAERRDQAAAWLADTAVRVAGWRGDVGPAFPGLPERGWR